VAGDAGGGGAWEGKRSRWMRMEKKRRREGRVGKADGGNCGDKK